MIKAFFCSVINTGCVIIMTVTTLLWMGMGANSAQAQGQNCLDWEHERGGIIGTANFSGPSWDGSRFGVGLVPGTGLDIVFEDGSSYQYGGAETGIIADNLFTLKNSATTLPYTAVQRTDGSIILILQVDCRGWMMVHPTIVPTGWDNHPLVRCLPGAYRATAEIDWQTNQSLVADFGVEQISLHSNFNIDKGAVIVEFFNGYAAISRWGTGCNFQYLEVAP